MDSPIEMQLDRPPSPEAMLLIRTMEILTRITSEEDVDHLSSLVVHNIPELVGARVCSLFLLRGNKLMLKATSSSELSPGESMAADLVGQDVYVVGEGLTGWVAEQRLPLRVPDVRTADEDLHRIAAMYSEQLGRYVPKPTWSGGKCHDAIQDRQFLGVPVIAGHDLIGVLRVSVKEPVEAGYGGPFGASEQVLLVAVATQLGVAIRGAFHKQSLTRARQTIQEANRVLDQLVEAQSRRRSDVDHVIESILKAALQLVPQATTAFMRVVSNGGNPKLVLRGVQGHFEGVIPEVVEIAPFSGGLAGRSAFLKASVVCGEFHNDIATTIDDPAAKAFETVQTYMTENERPGELEFLNTIHSGVAVPFSIGPQTTGDLSGVMVLTSNRKHAFHQPTDVTTLETFALLAAVAIESAKRAERLRQADRRARDEVTKEFVHQLKQPLDQISLLPYTIDRLLVDAAVNPELCKDVFWQVEKVAVNCRGDIDYILDNEGFLTEELHFRSLEPNGCLTRLCDDFQSKHPSVIIQTILDPRVSPIWADESKLVHCLDELLKNALREVEENGRITVRTELVEEHLIQLRSRSVRGPGVRIRVEDNGQGIPADLVDKVFERGFTLHPGRGYGLGLFQVRKLIEAHNGAIEAEPAPGGCLVIAMPSSNKKEGESNARLARARSR